MTDRDTGPADPENSPNRITNLPRQEGASAIGLRHTFIYAVDEANRFGQDFISTEHVLLAMLTTAGTLFDELRLDKAAIRRSIEHILGAQALPRLNNTELPLTNRTKRALDLAIDYHKEITERVEEPTDQYDLVMGLVMEGRGQAAQILESVGVNRQRLNTAIVRVRAGIADILPKPFPAAEAEEMREGLRRAAAHLFKTSFDLNAVRVAMDYEGISVDEKKKL